MERSPVCSWFSTSVETWFETWRLCTAQSLWLCMGVRVLKQTGVPSRVRPSLVPCGSGIGSRLPETVLDKPTWMHGSVKFPVQALLCAGVKQQSLCATFQSAQRYGQDSLYNQAKVLNTQLWGDTGDSMSSLSDSWTCHTIRALTPSHLWLSFRHFLVHFQTTHRQHLANPVV